jgi:excisionase family DNA binding protein
VFELQKITVMKVLEQIRKPSKLDQKIASESYGALASVIEQLNSDQPEIEIEETSEKIKIPLSALKLLGDILKAMGQGKLISLVPVATEMTTQAAAEILGCSRPHLVKLLEDGNIAFTKIGKHRRVKFDDIMKYRNQMKGQQKQNIIDIMNSDEETGLYDS